MRGQKFLGSNIHIGNRAMQSGAVPGPGPTPTVEVSSITFAPITESTATINWTAGNGSNTLVMLAEYTVSSAALVDGTTFTANTVMGSGDAYAGGHIVYVGTGTSVQVTNLVAGVPYVAFLTTFNTTGPGTENYMAADATGAVAAATIFYLSSTWADMEFSNPDSILWGVAETGDPRRVTWAELEAGLADEPTVQATSLVFSSVTSSGMTISWTTGNGTNDIVVVKATSAVDSDPVDTTTYTADTTFGSGTQIGSGNYVVYNSTGASVAITGLTPEVTYHVAVYAFNGSAGTENYMGTPLTGNQATTAIPAVWHSLRSWEVISPVSYVDVDWSSYSALYDAFEIHILNMRHVSDNRGIKIQPIIGGSVVATAIDYHRMDSESSGSGYTGRVGASTTVLDATIQIGAAAGESGNSVVHIHQPFSTDNPLEIWTEGAIIRPVGTAALAFQSGHHDAVNSAVDGIRVQDTGGGIASCSIILIGRNKVT